jgi:CelD/BcsL family acetyltransferase involved in cellulose biosynthesis
MKVDLHDRLETVGPATWNTLHARTRQRVPFLGWTWQTEWVRAFAAGHRLELWRVAEDDGSLVALLPLVAVDPATSRLVGGADVSDYLDLICAAGREEEAWAALLGARGVPGPAWELHAVPGGSPTVRALPALAAAAGLVVDVAVEERCPILDPLPASWDAYLAGLTGKQRHELTRKMRRLEREAPDARVTAAVSAAAVAGRLDDFLALHRRSRVGKARFMDDRMEGFFRGVITALAAGQGARVWLLDTDSGPLASFVTLEWDETVGLYNSGFHPERAALSPGLVLLAHVVRDAIERGKRRFDFLRGEERYKYDFGPTPEDVCAVTIRPAS